MTVSFLSVAKTKWAVIGVGVVQSWIVKLYGLSPTGTSKEETES